MQWKKHLTTMQITQFVIDLFVVYFASKHIIPSFSRRVVLTRRVAYNYYAANYFPHLPSLGSCAGTESAAVFGCLLLSSYLGLFINFYIQTYKKPVKGKGKVVANGKANGVASGNGCVVPGLEDVYKLTMECFQTQGRVRIRMIR